MVPVTLNLQVFSHSGGAWDFLPSKAEPSQTHMSPRIRQTRFPSRNDTAHQTAFWWHHLPIHQQFRCQISNSRNVHPTSLNQHSMATVPGSAARAAWVRLETVCILNSFKISRERKPLFINVGCSAAGGWGEARWC